MAKDGLYFDCQFWEWSVMTNGQCTNMLAIAHLPQDGNRSYFSSGQSLRSSVPEHYYRH